MATFLYQGYDEQGTSVEGSVDAASIAEAKLQLKDEKIILKSIKQETSNPLSLSLFQQEKVKVEDIEFLTAEISLLLESGVKIDKAIEILKKTKSTPGLKKILNSLSNALRKGSSMADAVREYPDIFDNLYINLITIGEETGRLSQVFKGLSTDLKFRRELKKKILQASIYPLVILSVCVLCVFAIFNFIVPKMSTLFSGVDDLPIYTTIMLSTSEWVQQYQSYLILAPILLVVVIQRLTQRQDFMKWWHRTSLNMPVLGNLSVQIERIRFNSGLSLMLEAGIPIDKALELSAGNIKNSVIKREMLIARDKIKNGAKLSATLQSTRIYPPFFASLLEVGEESGRLSIVFEEITQRTRNEFEDFTQKLTTMLEPMLILFMGLIVGSVVIVMLLSMVSVNDVSF